MSRKYDDCRKNVVDFLENTLNIHDITTADIEAAHLLLVELVNAELFKLAEWFIVNRLSLNAKKLNSLYSVVHKRNMMQARLQ